MNGVALHAPRFVLGDLLLTRLTRHRATAALVKVANAAGLLPAVWHLFRR
ncbi:hypothetical protein [Paractinoplanes toevensis]|uniref:Uncharacterized protein n=1 Tax=Paractinoplanes toevensis TaxID=571911 RepID=A0A919WC48_9ACTN|nr:hypothetical protein [Actinoplanes toevensis]GIM97358.1 hypothetical protein Ato02nite_091510 [Actinoplanes toevensis]